MSIFLPDALSKQLKKDHGEVLKVLTKKGYQFQDLPITYEAKRETGYAYTLSYPIQGILKYHGFANEEQRIPYFLNVSLNNDCVYTISYLNFDKNLKEDRAFLNGENVYGESLERIKLALDSIRYYTKVDTKAILISRNYLKSTEKLAIGKGLGTSASGSSTLALAAISILFNNDPKYMHNQRLISIFSRYLSGSGCRSATGGFSLWLSHPKIKPFDCYAIRLDKKEHKSFVDKISLLTIPIQSDLKTSEVHKIAPKSPFFHNWLKLRRELVFEFIEALDDHNLNKIGELAEYDTLCLHSITMTATNNQNIIAWKPDTLEIMHQVKDLRLKGYHVYFSIDTGPSLVLLTYKNEKKEIIDELKPYLKNHNLIEGELGGPCRLLDSESSEAKKLENDIKNFNETQM